MKTLLYGGRVITPWRILNDGYVLFDDANGKIEAVGSGAIGDIACDEKINVEGRYIAPGFIDIHTHGAGGYDLVIARVAEGEKND